MGHYRFYEFDSPDHIAARYSIECSSESAALRTARALLDRSAGVEVWKSDNCVAHLDAEARHLWPQLRDNWMRQAHPHWFGRHSRLGSAARRGLSYLLNRARLPFRWAITPSRQRPEPLR